MSATFDDINVVSGTLNIGSGSVYDIILSDTSGQPTIFNQNNIDIDFAVSGTNSLLYYDASTGRLGIGLDDPDTALHVIAPCANDGLKIEGTTNCPTGVRILLLHNPGIAPETGSYPSTIDLAGHDNNSQTIYYGQIRSRILSPETSATSGEIIFNVDHIGTLSTVFRANTANVSLGGLSTVTGYAYNNVGANNNLDGGMYVNIGSNNTASITTGLLLGNMIAGDVSNSIAVSNVGGVSGNKVILIGNNSFVSGHDAVVIANDTVVSGLYNVIVGNNVELSHNTNNIIGLFVASNISGQSGIGFGSNVQSTGNNNIFLGNSNSIDGSDNAIIGSYIMVTGNDNLVYGGSSSIDGSNIISIGSSNNPINVQSGLFVGNDIDLNNSQKAVVMGLGNVIVEDLSNSVLIGIENDTSAGTSNELVIIGQNNISVNADNSLVIGNKNNVSGSFNNSTVIGPDNFSAITSNNNIIIGALNNNTGLSIVSDGTVAGTSARLADATVNNSMVFGINNVSYDLTNAGVFGNKSYVSGSNLNSIGSFNNIKGDYIQNIGDRNFIVGDYINSFGGKNTVVGYSTLVNNPAKRSTWSFGSGNILFGDNEIIVSGLCAGFNNDLLGPDNIVYGRNNFIGKSRHPCVIIEDNTIVQINGDARPYYTDGDRILILLASPANPDSCIFERLVDTVTYDNVQGYTNIVITEAINSDGYDYGTRNTFDDDPVMISSLSGWAMPLQDGNDITDLITNPYYGRSNIVIGSDNTQLNNSGIVLGSANDIQGVTNIIIGHGLSGTYNRSVQIGVDNETKMVIEYDGVVFNSGAGQDYFIINSSIEDEPNTFKADLVNNRVGINVNNPRSTMDVSGTLTTESLRVQLTGVQGYTLISDQYGNATWQMPVNLSGDNGTILYKYSDTIASGIPELRFVSGSRSFGYLKPSDFDPTEFEDAFVLTKSGLYINNTDDNESVYNMVIKGSGDGLIDGQHDYNIRVNLFKTLPLQNAVQFYNITGISGHLYRSTVTNAMFLPTNLTGTLLKVQSNNGLLTSPTMPRNTVLFSDNYAASTGVNTLKYFSNDQALTVGTTGALTETQIGLFQGDSDLSSNIILASTSNFGTVINNGGHRHPFSVIDYNQGNNLLPIKQGMHYYTSGGVLGLGVNLNTTMQFENGGSLLSWYNDDTIKLVVAGKTKTNAIQLTPNGGFPADASARYLRADDDGNIELTNISLNTQFSGIWPMYVDASVATRVDMGLSTLAYPGAGSSISVGQNGFTFAWDGGRWTNNAKGLRVYQPDFLSTDLDTVPGVDIGVDCKPNYCNNSITMGGTAFINTNSDSRYYGSNQQSKFFLKGRTNSADAQAETELLSDFTKDVSNAASQNNTISVQYFYNPSAENNLNSSLWEPASVWQYKVNFCGLAAPLDIGNNETRNYKGVAGVLEGAVIIYRDPSDSTKVIRTLGTPSSTIYKDSQLSWTNDIVYVTGINEGNAQRLGVYARQLNGYNIIWTAQVDISQLNHPSGVNISSSF